MKENAYNPTLYGPYVGPTASNTFFAMTLAQGIENFNSLHGSFGHDINLNFNEKDEQTLGFVGPYYHYFITDFDGQIMKHSNVSLSSESESITKAEFSLGNTSLTDELFNEETKQFNDTFLPIFNGTSNQTVVSFYRYGRKFQASVHPIRARYLDGNKNPKFDQIFLLTQVIDEEYFVSIITDQSILVHSLTIWGSIFSIFFLGILITSICILSKIASRAIKPIKLLNSKVLILKNTKGIKTLEHAKSKMTSYEARLMFEVFTDLIPAVRFTNNLIPNDNSVISIMEYAEAYTVFEGNNKVQSICLTNMGHHYFKLKDFEKASKSYEEAAEIAYTVLNDKNSTAEMIQENRLPFAKRVYYASISKFFHLLSLKKSVTEDQILNVCNELKRAQNIIKHYCRHSVDDLLIMLNLYSSKLLLMTRRLISAEKDLKKAIKIFRAKRKIHKHLRPQIPIIPRCILRQRLVLQKSLVMLDFKKTKDAGLLLTKLLKIGKVYDPAIRKEALKTLYFLFTDHLGKSCFQDYPESLNVNKMIQLFQTRKKKNIVLLVDSKMDDYFLTKKNLCREIFD